MNKCQRKFKKKLTNESQKVNCISRTPLLPNYAATSEEPILLKKATFLRTQIGLKNSALCYSTPPLCGWTY